MGIKKLEVTACAAYKLNKEAHPGQSNKKKIAALSTPAAKMPDFQNRNLNSSSYNLNCKGKNPFDQGGFANPKDMKVDGPYQATADKLKIFRTMLWKRLLKYK